MNAAQPSFAEATRLWFKVGCLGFGGPAGQIALLHRLVVDEKKWVSDPQFLHALNFCMLLPGPEAQQLAAYLGWLLHGVRGGLVAGILFILPGNDPAPDAVHQPADIDRQLLRLWSRQQHAIVQRVQKSPLADPFLLIDQNAMHHRDLPGRPAETQ